MFLSFASSYPCVCVCVCVLGHRIYMGNRGIQGQATLGSDWAADIFVYHKGLGDF